MPTFKDTAHGSSQHINYSSDCFIYEDVSEESKSSISSFDIDQIDFAQQSIIDLLQSKKNINNE